MVKPEWGQKRVCATCAAHFYDLRRSPILCPKCKAEFDPEAILKSRRSRSSAAKAPPVEVRKPREEPEVPALVEEAEEEVEPVEEKEAAEVLEDTSDLAGDEDQVAEVREQIDDPQRE